MVIASRWMIYVMGSPAHSARSAMQGDVIINAPLLLVRKEMFAMPAIAINMHPVMEFSARLE
jgi:hypothetical protein